MRYRIGFLGLCLCLSLLIATGCSPLRPRSIDCSRPILSDELRDGSPQIQRGQPRKVIDTVGWVLGIPGKILLWNRRVDNHQVSVRTERAIHDYLVCNSLDTTRVRINQYAPGDDWRRLVKNKKVAAPWRYTFGTVVTLVETILPGRIIGGDHYNPYTDTIHLYSDIPAIAIHEAAHAKDFARRTYKGTYAAVYCLPLVPLYHESLASGDALDWMELNHAPAQQREAYNVLYPAYGTYVGSALGWGSGRYATPLFYGSLLGGHVLGRTISSRIGDQVSESSAELDGQFDSAGFKALEPTGAAD